MKNKLTNIIFTLFLISSVAIAQDCKYPSHTYGCHNLKQQKEIDAMLDSRLHLSQEQKDYIKQNRPKHKKEMETLLKQMQSLHDEIRNVYLTGVPKFQADIKTAKMKTELVLLKQNADKIKQRNRIDFENILNTEQKVEFEKIKKEFAAKNP